MFPSALQHEHLQSERDDADRAWSSWTQGCPTTWGEYVVWREANGDAAEQVEIDYADTLDGAQAAKGMFYGESEREEYRDGLLGHMAKRWDTLRAER